VRTTQVIGRSPTFSALAASVTCACGIHICGLRLAVEPAAADVGDDAEHLPFPLPFELGNHATADDEPVG
jgi:hypothetical protein